MPSLEVEIEMVTPTNSDPAGTNAKFYVSDHSHVGSNGEYYHGFIQKAPNLKLQDSGSGQIEMSGASIVLSNEPNNADHPFGQANYTKILSDTGPYYIGIKYQTAYNLFEGQLYIQAIDSESIRCNVKSIRPTDSGPVFDTEQDGISNTDSDLVSGFIWGDVVDWEVERDNSDVGAWDAISGSAVQAALYFYNSVDSVTPTIKVNGNASTWASTGSVRYDANASDDGSADSSLGAYQSTNNYADGTQYSFSATGIKNRNLTNGTNRSTPGRTIAEFAETMAYISSPADTHIPRLTNDKFYILETETIDTNKSPSPPNLSFVWNKGILNSFEALRLVSFASNYQFFVLPSQTNGNRTLYLIDKANAPSSSSAFYNTVSENDILSLVIRGPEEIKSIKGNYDYYRWQGTELIETKGGGTLFLDATGREVSFDALITNPSQQTNLTNVLNAMKAFYQKPTLSVEINDLHDEWRPGDRVVFNRRDEFVNVDMIIRSIEWNFNDLTTTIEGDATLTPYVQE